MFQKQWFLPCYLTPVLFSKNLIRPKTFVTIPTLQGSAVKGSIGIYAKGSFTNQGGIYLVIEFYFKIAHSFFKSAFGYKYLLKFMQHKLHKTTAQIISYE